MHWGRSSLIVAAAVGLLACSSSDNSLDSIRPGACAAHSNDDPATVCDQWAKAFCEYLPRCSPDTMRFYRSPEACVSLVGASCLDGLKIPGRSTGAGFIWLLSKAMSSSTCQTLDTSVDTSCPSSGSLENGASCFAGMQCKSDLCKKVTGEKCGECAPRLPEGAICTLSSECDSGFGCIDGACKKPTPVGEACTPLTQCEYGAYCENDRCTLPTPAVKNIAKGGKCQGNSQCVYGLKCYATCQEPVIAKEGEACFSMASLPCAVGLVCVNDKCEKYLPGSSCVSSSQCSMGQYCKDGTTCVDPSPSGGACVSSIGDQQCEAGLQCHFSVCSYSSASFVCD